jgi:hypothetical protein
MPADGWTIAQSIASVAAVVVATPSIVFAALQLKAGAEASKATADQAKSSAEAAHAAARQAKISAQAASASALGAISATSRELQWKVLEDEAVRQILTGGATLTDEMKRQFVRGMLISYYAFIYEIRQLEQIPDASWQAFISDMTAFFTQPLNGARWDGVKREYPKEFQDFIEYQVLHRPH